MGGALRLIGRMNITNETVSGFVNSFYEPQSAFLEKLRAEEENNGVPIIMRDTEMLLRSLVLAVSPENILEIGTARGYSSIFFATASCDAKVTTIEKDPVKAERAAKNTEAAGLSERISIKTGDAEDVLAEMVREGGHSFDFVFIDASKSHYNEFFRLSEKMMSPGGLVVCDNVLMKASVADSSYDAGGRHKTSIRKMRAFLGDVSKREDLDMSVIPCGDGVAIIQKK